MTPKPNLSDGIPLNEPQTEAGRALFLRIETPGGFDVPEPNKMLKDAVLAIEREAQGIPLSPEGEALRRLDNALYHLDSWVKHHAKCTVITEGTNEATGGGYRWTPGDRCSCGLQRAKADLSQARASLAATPPASGGIPLIDSKLPDLGILAAIFEDTPPAVLNSALLDSGEGLASWVVSHWAEYTRLASESSPVEEGDR